MWRWSNIHTLFTVGKKIFLSKKLKQHPLYFSCLVSQSLPCSLNIFYLSLKLFLEYHSFDNYWYLFRFGGYQVLTHTQDICIPNCVRALQNNWIRSLLAVILLDSLKLDSHPFAPLLQQYLTLFAISEKVKKQHLFWTFLIFQWHPLERIHLYTQFSKGKKML